MAYMYLEIIMFSLPNCYIMTSFHASILLLHLSNVNSSSASAFMAGYLLLLVRSTSQTYNRWIFSFWRQVSVLAVEASSVKQRLLYAVW